MRKYIFIAVSLLAILSCVKESVAPEQRITGIFALDDGSGLSDEYIEFKNGYLTTYSLRPKQKTFAEGKFWNASENDFYLDIAWRYSIIEDDLKAERKSRGKISISEDALKIGESTYTRAKGFESDHYSVIKPERTIVSVPYVQTTDTVACSIYRPIPAGTARVKSKPDFVSSASFDGENLIFTVDQTKTDRSGKIVLTYTNAEDVEIEVKQEQQTFIVLQPTSAEVSYQAGTGQFSFSIENPVEGELLSVQTYQNWVHDLAVDGNLVSFSYDENNSKSSRTASIICSYPGAKDVMFTLTQRYSAPTINTDPASTTATYSGGSYSIDCTIDNPREGAVMTATSTDSWISGIKVENGKVSFNVAENNSSAQRSGTIKLSYDVSGTVLATKNYPVVQTYSSSAINVSPESTTSTYAGGSFSINCVIDNPREAAVLTATTTSSWITGIKVENGKVSFNVAENNSSAQRSGTIKLSYGISGTTYATKDYPIVQNGAPVSSLTLNKTSLAMNAGTSETLVATVTPSGALLTWNSSNTSVATVDSSGKVTAVANGSATITVKTVDGSKTATCAVTVTIAVTGVSLNKTTLSLNAGSSETLAATVTPSTASNKAVIWSSSNTSVATVDNNGKVTAVANGSATITVKTVDGSKTATCSVTVTTAVTGVSLNKTTLSLNVGSSETLVATIAPSTASNKNVTWSSSNTRIAKVDGNGKVTANANGTATITVKTVDGSKTATCSVTVTTAVTSVSLNMTTLSLNVVGSSETLVATVAPSTASNKEVTWSSSSTSVATVDGNGKVTANANGTAIITVKTTDGNKTAECSVNVVDYSIPVDLGLSVKWAQCNLGASTPEGYGDYYAWGATEPWYKDGYAQSSSPQWKSGKSEGYSWANCPFNGGNSLYNSSYWNAHKSECVDANNTLLPANDAAHVNLGGNWRMPTKEEFDELANTSNCSRTWTTLNGINGYKVQSKKSGYTDNWIFLPAAGYRSGTNLDNVGSGRYYWSSSLSSDDPNEAWDLYFFPGHAEMNCGYRLIGRPVRPVTE